MVQINLKLRLSKIKYGIKVSYNTFEKATFDQFLMASVALRSESFEDANTYIDNITGSGSLNAHFKQLYEKASKLDKNQLADIMNNSMYPMLKIDKSNSYDYYPELNVSVFNNRVYQGDFGKYEDLIERLYIQEKVIESEVFVKSNKATAEPYSVKFEGSKILVKIAEEWIDLDSDIFQEIFDNVVTNINTVESEIHNGADGAGWFALTNAVVNNMYSSNNFFYDNGDHCLIRNDDVRKTIISRIAGMFIYREEVIPYLDNQELCEKVLGILVNNKAINEFKTRSLVTLLTFSNDLLAQSIINYILTRKDSKELALMGIELLVRGVEKNWEDEALKTFMDYADSSKYSLIYRANPKLISDIQTLSMINPDFLIPAHKKEVEEYKKDREAKITTIQGMIGEITTSGIREKSKQIASNDGTKRFSKLANKYIGHSKIDFENATQKELDKYLKEIAEMYDLMKGIQLQIIKEQKKNGENDDE